MHSVVSLPLVVADQVVGAINVYAHDKQVFDDRASEVGEVFAIPAAVAAQNGQVLAQTRRIARPTAGGGGHPGGGRAGGRDPDQP